MYQKCKDACGSYGVQHERSAIIKYYYNIKCQRGGLREEKSDANKYNIGD